MKKENLIVVTILVVAIIAICFTNNRINKIENQLKLGVVIEKTESEEVEKTEIVLQGEYADFVQAMFPFNGKYYVESSNNITFYSDIECTKKITGSLRFLSRNTETVSIGNMQIYCYLLESGKICYSKGDKYPNLLSEEQYDRYIKEE